MSCHHLTADNNTSTIKQIGEVMSPEKEEKQEELSLSVLCLLYVLTKSYCGAYYFMLLTVKIINP